MKNFLKKYSLSIIIILLMIVIGIILLSFLGKKSNTNNFKIMNNKSFSLKYDSSWKVKSNKDSDATLVHKKSNSILDIRIITLIEENRYQAINEFKDDFIYEIENQNKDYKLIAEENIEITKNNYEGYKMLYENGDNQSLVLIAKTSDKLIIFNYKTEFVYFDLVLDSVNNIIYNFEIKEDDYELTYKMDYKLSEMSFKENKVLDNKLKDSKEYVIGANNYLVEYYIPSNFKLNEFNSKLQIHRYEEEDYRISITANIYKKNIYEYIDKNADSMMYKEFGVVKKQKDYSNQRDELMDLGEGVYAYRYFYTSKGKKYDKDFNAIEYDKLYEVVYLLFSLDKNHVFEIKMDAIDTSISKKLIDMIKIKSTKEISSNFDRVVKDDELVGELKRYTDYNKDKVESVTLKVPSNYVELDNDTNLFENRNYALNYNTKYFYYEYEVSYSLIDGFKMDAAIDLINSSYSSYSSYGEIQSLESIGKKILNDKEFIVYKGGYHNRTGGLIRSDEDILYKVDSRVLYYILSDDSYVEIHIKSKNNEISDEVMNYLTNFEVNYLNLK